MFVTSIISAIADCHSDPGKLSAEQAHRVMQTHLECSVDLCRARRRARQVLVEAKLMVLDQRAG
ncbi:hypothetical protein DFR71_4896 [Nocardia alba]|uniref:Uncharacterized protein n=1 Tax=Nocardia alba TaxID=225051 RepID=A0A4R1FHR7_9NOCA|nr:hypothetical protein DFR71_4896 [Nocardia alba]